MSDRSYPPQWPRWTSEFQVIGRDTHTTVILLTKIGEVEYGMAFPVPGNDTTRIEDVPMIKLAYELNRFSRDMDKELYDVSE